MLSLGAFKTRLTQYIKQYRVENGIIFEFGNLTLSTARPLEFIVSNTEMTHNNITNCVMPFTIFYTFVENCLNTSSELYAYVTDNFYGLETNQLSGVVASFNSIILPSQTSPPPPPPQTPHKFTAVHKNNNLQSAFKLKQLSDAENQITKLPACFTICLAKFTRPLKFKTSMCDLANYLVGNRTDFTEYVLHSVIAEKLDGTAGSRKTIMRHECFTLEQEKYVSKYVISWRCFDEDNICTYMDGDQVLRNLFHGKIDGYVAVVLVYVFANIYNSVSIPALVPHNDVTSEKCDQL
jgi:hypothetical protein